MCHTALLHTHSLTCDPYTEHGAYIEQGTSASCVIYITALSVFGALVDSSRVELFHVEAVEGGYYVIISVLLCIPP